MEGMGYLVLRGAIMRKFILLAVGSMAAATVLLSTGAAAEKPPQRLAEVEEQVILRLLHRPTVKLLRTTMVNTGSIGSRKSVMFKRFQSRNTMRL